MGWEYGSFAAVYDLFSPDEEYDIIADRIDDLIAEKLVFETGKTLRADLTIADIACGTGKLCRRLADMCYKVIGGDLSDDCLTIASSKGGEITYIRQDMRSVDFPAPVDVITCTLDSLNHLESLDDISKCFEAVNNNLRKGGLFIFDMNTPYKHEKILSDNTFVYEDEKAYLVWMNEYIGGEDCRVDMSLDIFIKEGGMYRRSSEDISEIAFDSGVIAKYLENAGFEVMCMTDGYTDKAVDAETERITYCARKI